MQCINMWEQINITQHKNFTNNSKTQKFPQNLKNLDLNAWNAFGMRKIRVFEYLLED